MVEQVSDKYPTVNSLEGIATARATVIKMSEINIFVQEIEDIVNSLPDNWQAKGSVGFSAIPQMERVQQAFEKLKQE